MLRFPLPLHDVDEQCRDRRGRRPPSRLPRSDSTTTPPANFAWFLVDTVHLDESATLVAGKFHMAHGSMATDTRDVARSDVGGRPHRLDDGLVAAAAIRLCDGPARRQRPDWLGERAACEVVRVPEAIGGFRQVLGHKRVGHVTVVADGDRAMAALDPAVVLLVHDVAVAQAAGRRSGRPSLAHTRTCRSPAPSATPSTSTAIANKMREPFI